MKLSLSVESREDDQLIFAQQLGVEEIFSVPVNPGTVRRHTIGCGAETAILTDRKDERRWISYRVTALSR